MSVLWLSGLFSGILLLLLNQLVAAPPDDSPTDEKVEFKRELETLRRSKPSAYEETRTLATFGAEYLLARLGYGIGPFKGVHDEKLRDALKAYEANSGIPVTGDPLSFETLKKIQSDAALLESAPVVLPPLHVLLDLWDRGFVSATGTWTIIGDAMAWPEQTSEVTCLKNTGLCTLATAMVFGKGTSRQISVDTEQHEIERWDEYEIVTKPYQHTCTRYVYRINRTQKSVSGLRTVISTDAKCRHLSNADMNLALVAGGKVWGSLNENYQRSWKGLMQISPALLKKLNSSR